VSPDDDWAAAGPGNAQNRTSSDVSKKLTLVMRTPKSITQLPPEIRLIPSSYLLKKAIFSEPTRRHRGARAFSSR